MKIQTRHHVQIIFGLTHGQDSGKAHMRSGNRCSKITRVEVSEEKFICVDIAGERQNSV